MIVEVENKLLTLPSMLSALMPSIPVFTKISPTTCPPSPAKAKTNF